MTKRVWVAEGLATPRWVWLARDQTGAERLRTVPDELGLPLIVKPPREGSSIGITKVMGYSQMQDAVRLSRAIRRRRAVRGVHRRHRADLPGAGRRRRRPGLPVIRIDAPDGNYDYQHKYFSDDTGYRCPSGLPEAEEREVQPWRWRPTARWAAAAGAAPT